MAKPTVFDLFCGCGGLSLGLSEAGFDVRWACETWLPAAETFRNTHPDTQLFECDARELLSRLRNSEQGLPKPGDVDMLVGGPPCQGFSGYNRYRGTHDPRNNLVPLFIEYVGFFRPSQVLIENVTGLLSLDNGSMLVYIENQLSLLGYYTDWAVVQAAAFGVPQNRWRFFMRASLVPIKSSFPMPITVAPRTPVFNTAGHRHRIIRPLEPSGGLFCDINETPRVKHCIGDLPPLVNGQSINMVTYTRSPANAYEEYLREGCPQTSDHSVKLLKPVTMERVEALPKGVASGWLDLPESLQPANLKRYAERLGPTVHGNRFGRANLDGIFNTIVQQAHPYWGAFLHPFQDRVLSLREVARAQSFRDRIVFHGTLKDKYKQVGNAIPPLLACELGKHILKTWPQRSS